MLFLERQESNSREIAPSSFARTKNEATACHGICHASRPGRSAQCPRTARKPGSSRAMLPEQKNQHGKSEPSGVGRRWCRHPLTVECPVTYSSPSRPTKAASQETPRTEEVDPSRWHNWGNAQSHALNQARNESIEKPFSGGPVAPL